MGGATLTPALLELRDVTVAPPGGRAPLLAGVSLGLAPGELGVLLGGNGSGKSSLLRTAAGLWPARGGAVLLDGVAVTAFDPARIALVGEDPWAQMVTTTVRRELEFTLECDGVAPEAIAQRTDASLAAFALDALGGRDATALSAGEQESVLLAAALVRGPRALLLDDPFLYLDPDHAWAAWERLRRALATGETGAILLATHDPDLAAEADRVGVLDAGTLSGWGPPGDVLRAPLPASVGTPLAVRIEAALREAGCPLGSGGLGTAALAERIAPGR